MDPYIAIQRTIASKETDLAAKEREVDLMRAEITGYRGALKLLSPQSKVAQLSELNDAVRTVEPAEKTTRMGRREPWRSVMRRLHAQGVPYVFRLHDIAEAALKHGAAIKDQTIRGQMSTFTAAGLFDRVSLGQFRITEKGAEAFQINMLPTVGNVKDTPAADGAQAAGVRGSVDADPEHQDANQGGSIDLLSSGGRAGSPA